MQGWLKVKDRFEKKKTFIVIISIIVSSIEMSLHFYLFVQIFKKIFITKCLFIFFYFPIICLDQSFLDPYAWPCTFHKVIWLPTRRYTFLSIFDADSQIFHILFLDITEIYHSSVKFFSQCMFTKRFATIDATDNTCT